MAQVTHKGTTLLKKLLPSIEHEDWSWSDVAGICSLIARHATAHHRLAESDCDGPQGTHRLSPEQANKRIERFYAMLERRQQQIEDRITVLVSELPRCNGESISVVFSGDPRGCTVKLVMPDGRYDDWGQVGLCVPQDHS